MEAAPNLQVNASNARQTSISIRGIGKNTAVEALEASVGVIVDGVFVETPGMSWGDYTSIDNIEILRGPQGTLLGKNTTLGVLMINTKPPSFTPETLMELTAGNRNLFNTKLDTTGTAIENTLAYRISGYYDTQDGFLKNIEYNNSGAASGPQYWDNGLDRWGGRIQLLYTPNKDVTVRTIYEHSVTNDPINLSILPADPQTYTNTGASRVTTGSLPGGGTVSSGTYTALLQSRFNYNPLINSWNSVNVNSHYPVQTNSDAASTQIDWKLDGYTLTSISAYRRFHFDPQNDGDLTPFDIIHDSGGIVDSWQASQELRLASPHNQDILGQKVDWQGGLFALYNDVKVNSYTLWGKDAGAFYASNKQYAALTQQQLSDTLNGVFQQQVQNPTTLSLAAFGQGTWHVTDKADLTLGVRNTWEDRANSIQQTYTGGVDSGSLNADQLAVRNAQLKLIDLGNPAAPYFGKIVGRDLYADSWSWLVNPSYKITPDILAYFSASFGEKSGAVTFNTTNDPNSTNSYVLGTQQNILPEDAMDYELGLKTTWFDHKLTINPNLYYVDVKNYQAVINQVYPGQPSNTSVLANVKGVHLEGAEVEGNYATPIENLTITFSGSYNNATYSDFKNAPCASDYQSATGVCDFTGRQLQGSSKWIGNIGFTYKHPLFDTGYTAYFWGNESYKTATNLTSTLDALGIQKAYSLVNAGIGIRPDGKNWEAELWGKNITNTHYYTFITQASSTAAITGAPGDPITFGITYRQKF